MTCLAQLACLHNRTFKHNNQFEIYQTSDSIVKNVEFLDIDTTSLIFKDDATCTDSTTRHYLPNSDLLLNASFLLKGGDNLFAALLSTLAEWWDNMSIQNPEDGVSHVLSEKINNTHEYHNIYQ